MSSSPARGLDTTILLSTAPLLSATIHLSHSLDQYTFLRPFTQPSLINKRETNHILPTYFSTIFLQPGVFQILLLHGITISTGLISLRRGIIADHAARWYKAGIALSAAHFFFVPLIVWKVQAISDDESRGKSTLDLVRWLRIHLLRLVSVDVPSCVCLLVGTLKTLQVVGR